METSRGRSRGAGSSALIWLFFLGDPLGAIHDHAAGAVQMSGYLALAAFAVVYVGVLAWGRTMRHAWRVSAPLAQRWTAVAALLGLGLLTMPAAGPHGRPPWSTSRRLAMMLLPLR